jgi:hypothetical protein
MDWVPDLIGGEDMAPDRPGCLSITEFLHHHDCTPLELIKSADGGTEPAPAFCTHGCTVRLEETCTHGCPSLLLTLMMYDYQCSDPVG